MREQWSGGGGRAADDDVVAAAGACVASGNHEFFGAQARLAGFFVENLGVVDHFVPGIRRVNVDLDDAGIGRNLDDVEARVVRRGVALDDDGVSRRSATSS